MWYVLIYILYYNIYFPTILLPVNQERKYYKRAAHKATTPQIKHKFLPLLFNLFIKQERISKKRQVKQLHNQLHRFKAKRNNKQCAEMMRRTDLTPL